MEQKDIKRPRGRENNKVRKNISSVVKNPSPSLETINPKFI